MFDENLEISWTAECPVCQMPMAVKNRYCSLKCWLMAQNKHIEDELKDNGI